MRQEWIEFEGREGNKVLLRPEYISSVVEKSGDTGGTTIGYDEHPILDGDQVIATSCNCKEPYEQVKQKIMDAEKVDFSDVAVEHFTNEEYEFIKAILPMCLSEVHFEIIGQKDKDMFDNIMNKLNEILKEDK